VKPLAKATRRTGTLLFAAALLAPAGIGAQDPAPTPTPTPTPAADDAWTAPPDEQARRNPVSPSRDALRRGRALFLRHCANCHGKEGRGDGPAAAFGMVSPRDLTSPTVQARMTDGDMFWKISKGRRLGGEVLMPPGEEKISRVEDRWRVVLFVRSLLPGSSQVQ
jgi:mono/diheme cytochrome c family protein